MSNSGLNDTSKEVSKAARKEFYEKNANNLKLMAMFVISFAVLTAATGGRFFSAGQMKLIAYLFPEMGVLSLGMMLAMISGGIDLTVVAVADLSGILCCMLLKAVMPEGASVPVQIMVLLLIVAVGLVIGGLCGIFSGTLISRIGIPAMVATLGASDIILGLAVGITNGSSVKELPPILNKVVSYRLFDMIPASTIIFAICAGTVAFILNRTSLGFKIYMIGSNKTATRYSGIDDKRVITLTYMISGMLSSVSGLLMCGHFNSARSDFGKSYLTPAILICVLAGVSPNGGKGKAAGMVIAVVILQTLSSGFSMFQNISDYYKNLIWGLVLILVMIINVTSERRKARS
ncbi:ABC transporter permease [uncultured Clostridium sp.]|uniref:ABC transporter permease n=1 Tax=uncultured Clostridium sp. TaxID=59620 RepID=UPI0025EAECED|nr:ABC transporter permease [uncultured Clostridium sp.]